MIVDRFLCSIDLVALERLNRHLLTGRLVVHLIREIARPFALGFLPGIELIETAIPAVLQLSLAQTSQLELGPRGNIDVLLDEEDFKAVVSQLDAVLYASVVDREWEINDLNVPYCGHIHLEDVLSPEYIDGLNLHILDGQRDCQRLLGLRPAIAGLTLDDRGLAHSMCWLTSSSENLNLNFLEPIRNNIIMGFWGFGVLGFWKDWTTFILNILKGSPL